MNTANEVLKSHKGWSSLQRPRFSAGLLLEDQDLTAGVDYTRNLMRLMLRALFGCGVICGLEVTAELSCYGRKLQVQVGPGLALDGMGNPIHIVASDTVIYDAECKKLPDEVWVVVCHVEKCCRPRDVSCDEDSRAEPTRAVDGYEIQLFAQPPRCACSCKPATPPAEKPKDGCCQDQPVGAPSPTPPPPNPTPNVKKSGQAKSGTAKMSTKQKSTAQLALEDDQSAKDAAADKKQLSCDCFKAHNEGKCACDCAEGCVVIARIPLPGAKEAGEALAPSSQERQELEADQTMVRRIRPVLTGYLDCLACPLATKAPPEGSPPVDPVLV
jgi:hypothetical protein